MLECAVQAANIIQKHKFELVVSRQCEIDAENRKTKPLKCFQ